MYVIKNEIEIILYLKIRYWNYKNINKKINYYIVVDESLNICIYIDFIDK